jgi:hypothetical protein
MEYEQPAGGVNNRIELLQYVIVNDPNNGNTFSLENAVYALGGDLWTAWKLYQRDNNPNYLPLNCKFEEDIRNYIISLYEKSYLLLYNNDKFLYLNGSQLFLTYRSIKKEGIQDKRFLELSRKYHEQARSVLEIRTRTVDMAFKLIEQEK